MNEQIRRLVVLAANNNAAGILVPGDVAANAPGREQVGKALKEVSRPAYPERWKKKP